MIIRIWTFNQILITFQHFLVLFRQIQKSGLNNAGNYIKFESPKPYCCNLLFLSFQYFIILGYFKYITCYMILVQLLSEPILVLSLHLLYHQEVQKIQGNKVHLHPTGVKWGILVMNVNCGHLIPSESSLRLSLQEIEAKSSLKSLFKVFSTFMKGKLNSKIFPWP